MRDSWKIIEEAKRVIKQEAAALDELSQRISDDFAEACFEIANSKGKVITTGIGKSGKIADRLAAMLSTIGVSCLYLHPTEALHGELGLIQNHDVLVAFSNSGNNKEINSLLKIIKEIRKIKVIGITSKKEGQMSNFSDILIEIGESKEVCPYDFLPTTSSIKAYSIIDAISICVMLIKQTKKEDLLMHHPEGALQRKFFSKVKDVMHKSSEVPKVKPWDLMKDAILEMTSKLLGMTAVVDENDKILGIITDGDLRRLIQKKVGENIWEIKVQEVMTKNPKKIEESCDVKFALEKMRYYAITSLLVADKDNKLIGVVHMHDLLRVI